VTEVDSVAQTFKLDVDIEYQWHDPRVVRKNPEPELEYDEVGEAAPNAMVEEPLRDSMLPAAYLRLLLRKTYISSGPLWGIGPALQALKRPTRFWCCSISSERALILKTSGSLT
jgi:hypothetical protein